MKFTAEKTLLKSAIASAMGAVESRNTIPVLANVLIEAVDNKVAFTGTNLDQQVRALCDANVEDNGSITAPAAKLKEIINAAPEGAEISFEVTDGINGSTLTVKYGRSRFKVQTLPSQDFPAFANFTPDVTVKIAAAELLSSLKYVEFSQSTEEVRYYLQGVNIECASDNELKLTSTDGHKLSHVSVEANFEGYFNGILPRRAVGELLRLLVGVSGDVTFTAGKVFTFEVGDTVLSSKAIDGQFPDYKRVIPSASKHTAKIDAKRLAQAAKRAVISCDGKTPAVTLSIVDGDMTVSARGSLTEGADVMAVDADFNLDFGLNAKYLIDALARYDGDVDVYLNDAASPTLWTDERGLTVIMPLRI